MNYFSRHPFVSTAGLIFVLLTMVVVYFAYPPSYPEITFPDGKKFALTIVDDTDMTTMERIVSIYDVLHRHGMRTTKTTWIHPAMDYSNNANNGVSLADMDYRDFLLDLQQKGFEIAIHGVRGGSSNRDEILEGIEIFRKTFGEYPDLHINHSLNSDNLYWGRYRWSLAPYRLLYTYLFPHDFNGHLSDSPSFWGDVAKEHISYVRRFTFSEPNLLKIVPGMPYHLEEKPYVNYWFPGSNGGNVENFEILLSPENLDRLEREGGVTFVYAHLGAGSFSLPDGRVDPRFIERIRDISGRNGWFAPASTILEYLRSQSSWTGKLSFREKVRLETQFIFQRFFSE